MVFYKITATGSFKKEVEGEKGSYLAKEEYLRYLNYGLEESKDDNSRWVVVNKEPDGSKGYFFHAGYDLRKDRKNKIKNFLADAVRMQECGTFEKIVGFEEISADEYRKAIRRCSSVTLGNKSSSQVLSDLDIDYDESGFFEVKDSLIRGDSFTKKNALREAENFMADQTLLDEINRIYAKENIKEFYGHPVHYIIRGSEYQSAKQKTKILIKSLLANGRLQNGRILSIYNVNREAHDYDWYFDKAFISSKGGTIIIDLSVREDEESNHASEYEEVVNCIVKRIEKHKKDVLIILLEPHKNVFSKSISEQAYEILRLIEIKDGYTDRDKAQSLLEDLVQKSDVIKLKNETKHPLLPEKKLYSLNDVYKAYDEWHENCLVDSLYSSYDSVAKHIEKQRKEKEQEHRAIVKMDQLIGLEEAKKIVKQIIATGKMNRLREQKGLLGEKPSMHMVFSGNPGTAKTTMARMLSQVLLEEGIIEFDRFVECGRSDLVGKYVGWTAKAVVKKFNEARGGILFIDEAYSLIDHHENSFGDEAINTIVQEMENRRDDVIVIFAGYKEKMQDFLERNDGLRSRIAFHLDFPDYTADELMKILDYILREKGYSIDIAARKKVKEILATTTKTSNFCNGRFVRNLVEQAYMKQSLRLYEVSKNEELTKKELKTLISKDFEVNILNSSSPKGQIGFICHS